MNTIQDGCPCRLLTSDREPYARVLAAAIVPITGALILVLGVGAVVIGPRNGISVSVGVPTKVVGIAPTEIGLMMTAILVGIRSRIPKVIIIFLNVATITWSAHCKISFGLMSVTTGDMPTVQHPAWRE